MIYPQPGNYGKDFPGLLHPSPPTPPPPVPNNPLPRTEEGGLGTLQDYFAGNHYFKESQLGSTV